MSTKVLKVGILIVSTTASQDASTDKTTGILESVFSSHQPAHASWEVAAKEIVSDDVNDIQRVVKKWTDEDKLNLVLTSGGTGFAVSDCTPEAIAPLIEKNAVGIVQGMLSASLAITPFAMMSRPVAGVRKSTLIITLPGSPRGAKENLDAIINQLPHACIQAADLQSSRKLHAGGTKALEKEVAIAQTQPSGGHSCGGHHHHHHHHGPTRRTNPQVMANKLTGAVTERHRSSPYPMISVTEAHELIAQNTSLGEIVEKPVNEDLVGYVLAEDVSAPEAVPAFRASIVDGYAVIAKDGPGKYPIVSISHATASADSPRTLKSGEIARITTGAPVPDGATAVVMVEDTVISKMTEDGKEEAEVEILATGVPDGDNIREIGSDVQKGDLILRKGERITATAGEVGLLASVGVATVKVYRLPTVGVLSTGDEVVEHSRPGDLRTGEIRDSNRPALLTAVKSWGFPVVDLGIAKDSPGSLEDTLTAPLPNVDVIITTGGVSMGELDLLKPTIEQALKGTIHFGRVAMKPGKPTTFATVTAFEKNVQIFALPGNPASAIVTFHLFVLPALRKAAGYDPYHLPIVRVTVDQDIPLDPRPEYHRVHVSQGADGKLHAASTGGQRSSRVGSLKKANALLCLPSGKEVGDKRKFIPKGDSIEALLIGSLV